MTRIAHVTVPAPHHIGTYGPEWAWLGVFGDDRVRLVGLPAGEDAPACVALYVCEDIDPRHGVTAYLDPTEAHGFAGAVLAAADADTTTGNGPGSAVHPAKNEPAEPGLPQRSADHLGRNPMVRTLTTAARRVTRRDRVSYTPRQLNRLVTSVTARELAGRFRERAAWHRDAAHTVRAHHPDVAGWHRDEADALDAMADREAHR